MRLTKLILGTLVLAASFQTLFAQTTKAPINIAGKPNKFDLAQASGFDFAEVSNLTHAGMNSANPKVTLGDNRPQDAPSNDLCYSMRVYEFTRKDGEAPQMTGSTTCTPANRAAPKSIDGIAPKARYVPQ
ncbi:MAG TPA: hypothetical protein VK699_16330 [Terriglobales bacterium]|jgi:hypothetical protein|nr:hypothetical protein [Terriglobales bacterium]